MANERQVDPDEVGGEAGQEPEAEAKVEPFVMKRTGVPRKDANGHWTLDPEPSSEGESSATMVVVPAGPMTIEDLQTVRDRTRQRPDVVLETPEEAQRGADRVADFFAKRRAKDDASLSEIIARAERKIGFVVHARDEQDRALQNEVARDKRLQARLAARVPTATTVCPKGHAFSNNANVCGCDGCGEKYVPVTWALLAGLKNRSGLDALGGVEDFEDRLLHGAEAVRELRGRLEDEDRNIVLFGPPRTGKSLTAAAYVNDLLRQGRDRIVWTHVLALRDPKEIDRALGAQTLILDDMGAEFVGAKADSDIASRRAAPVAEVVKEFFDIRGRRLIVTTYLDEAAMERSYDAGVASRIYEAPDKIILRRQ